MDPSKLIEWMRARLPPHPPHWHAAMPWGNRFGGMLNIQMPPVSPRLLIWSPCKIWLCFWLIEKLCADRQKWSQGGLERWRAPSSHRVTLGHLAGNPSRFRSTKDLWQQHVRKPAASFSVETWRALLTVSTQKRWVQNEPVGTAFEADGIDGGV